MTLNKVISHVEGHTRLHLDHHDFDKLISLPPEVYKIGLTSGSNEVDLHHDCDLPELLKHLEAVGIVAALHLPDCAEPVIAELGTPILGVAIALLLGWWWLLL